ncbi:hypothetical protein BvCmsKSP026_05076 [Escherichia coli]|nr:hypothetical protein ExPECSC032_00665 [Escherichia coli]GCT04287.1 hypothetical protein HmCms146_04812 [Escherichia coli]GCY05499.1 hypothetical protein HmCmsJML114_01655 [Escherichia coli]GCY05812.1 hypothetical protein HmCmsJML092_03150 [Escherichia coli]GDI06389.1 hypothetical protein BvCmsKKP062_05010 [Escherichia coli]
MTGQEDKFPRCETGNHNVDNHRKEHNHRHFFPEAFLRYGNNGFIVRHDTLNTKGMLENVCEVTQ